MPTPSRPQTIHQHFPPNAPTDDLSRRNTDRDNTTSHSDPSARDELAPSTTIRQDKAATRLFFTSWRWWLPLAVLSLALSFIFRDPFAGDWDSLDYTVLALEGKPSSMLLGRMLFIFTNGWLYRIAHFLFGLEPANAYLLFKYFVIAQTPFAVIIFWQFARELTDSKLAATFAALMLALSPYFIIYSGQAMTEIPSLLWLGVALLLHWRGVRERRAWLVLLGACLMGAGTNIRELAALYGVWLVCAPLAVYGRCLMRRELLTNAAACFVFFVCALLPFAVWYGFNIEGYRDAWWGWMAATQAETARHPVALANFREMFAYFFFVAPIPLVLLPLAAWHEWRTRGFSPLLTLALIGLFANLSLIVHYSLTLNGRYMLTGLSGLAPLVGSFVAHHWSKPGESYIFFARRGFQMLIVAAFLMMLNGAITGRFVYPTIPQHAAWRDYRTRLMQLPTDAVVMAGGQTVAVTFWRGVGAGRWEVIGTGSGWVGERLTQVIDEHLRNGRRVFLDTDRRLWSARGWQQEETQQIAGLQTRYRFRRTTDTIYEVRPLNDLTATDDPNLSRLAPDARDPVREAREDLLGAKD